MNKKTNKNKTTTVRGSYSRDDASIHHCTFIGSMVFPRVHEAPEERRMEEEIEEEREENQVLQRLIIDSLDYCLLSRAPAALSAFTLLQAMIE